MQRDPCSSLLALSCLCMVTWGSRDYPLLSLIRRWKDRSLRGSSPLLWQHCIQQHSRGPSPPAAFKKMSENLTRWEVWRIQRLRRNIRRVETGMVFAVWAFEKLFTRLSCEESFTRLSLRLPEASVTGTTREQCFHIDFKRSFLRILGGGEKLTMKGKNCQNCTNTHPHTHTYNESVVFF